MNNGDVCVIRPDETINCYGKRDLELSAPNDRQYLRAHQTCAIRAEDLNVDCVLRFFGGGFRNWQTDPVLYGQKLIDFRLGDKLRCGIRFSDNRIICEGYPTNSTPSNFDNWVSPNAYDVIDMSGNVVCGIRSTNGEVSCWGSGTPEILSPPTGVSFDSISVGSFGCGIKSTDGSIACWGTTHTPPPGSFQKVSVGNDFACAITNGQSLVCFGNTPAPVQAAIGVRALEISAFQDKLCAKRALDQAVQCWGFQDPPMGQPGEMLSSISTVFSGYCGLRNTGEYVCRGYRIVNPW